MDFVYKHKSQRIEKKFQKLLFVSPATGKIEEVLMHYFVSAHTELLTGKFCGVDLVFEDTYLNEKKHKSKEQPQQRRLRSKHHTYAEADFNLLNYSV